MEKKQSFEFDEKPVMNYYEEIKIVDTDDPVYLAQRNQTH